LKLVFKLQANPNQGSSQVAVQKKEPLILKFSREVFNAALKEITEEEERKRQALIAALRAENEDKMDVDMDTSGGVRLPGVPESDPLAKPLSRRLKLIAGPESTAEAIGTLFDTSLVVFSEFGLGV
jgi:hypothetical protein